MKILYEFFSNFKYCRRKLGGTWYQVEVPDESGWSSTNIYWTRNKPVEGEELIKTERYGE